MNNKYCKCKYFVPNPHTNCGCKCHQPTEGKVDANKLMGELHDEIVTKEPQSWESRTLSLAYDISGKEPTATEQEFLDFISSQIRLAEERGANRACSYVQNAMDEPEQTKSRYQIIQEARKGV